jgi:hypothetical protein
MRKALHAALTAAAISILAAPANQAAAMPTAAPSAIGAAAKQPGAVLQAHYAVYHRHPNWAWHPSRYGVWRGPYWYPRHYWYAYPPPAWYGYYW